MTPYIGRFAPSPTGPLHAGSLVAALASWLDARAHAGQWLVRMEDVDTPRCLPAMDALILQQLSACGLHSDQPVARQSQRSALYQQALNELIACGMAYACGCSRKDIAQAHSPLGQARPRHGELIYPGTCRSGLQGKTGRAWRLCTDKFITNKPPEHAGATQAATYSIATSTVTWTDRRLGVQTQNVAQDVGDFVLKRADGCFAYQLAVVVDDAAQGVTDVVRGEDLADNTARQIWLQQALGLPQPRYFHTPLVRAADGEKLSKQNGAQPFDAGHPLAALNAAAATLGLSPQNSGVAEALASWMREWRHHWARAPYNLVP